MPDRGPGPLFYTHNGQTLTLRQWAEQSGINYITLYHRIRKRHMSLDHALNPNHLPTGKKPKRYTHAGKTLTLHQWAEYLGVRYALLRRRLASGVPAEQALTADRLSPRLNTKTHTVNGITKTLPEWAEHLGITYSALMQRLTRYTLAEAIAIPPRRVVRRKGRGVASDLEASRETGAWGFPQEMSNITSTKKDEV